MKVKITYTIDREDWTDEQFEDQEDQIVYLTLSDIQDLLERKGQLKQGDELDSISIEVEHTKY